MDASKIDRRTTTPFLLRLFYRSGSFQRLEDFSPNGPLPPHVQIYTWQSCTLKELSHLITSALPNLFPQPFVGTRLSFRLIFADTSQRHGPGRYRLEDIGTVVIGADSSSADANDNSDNKVSTAGLEGDTDKTLQDARFVIGDYISCAILPPSATGDIASAIPRGASSRSQGPPRQNGYSGDHGSYARRGSGRYDRDERRMPGGVPPGDWRRGDVPPNEASGGYGGRGRGRGRGGRW